MTDIKIKRRSNNIVKQPSLGLPNFLEKIFYNRGVTCKSDIDLQLKSLIPISSLYNSINAAKVIADFLSDNKKILIIGDFDADGASSCTLAILAIKAMGYNNIDFLIPNRFEFGYGLTSEIVEQAKKKSPDLIITVDNGISSIDGVNTANKAGIKVIITDHHLPGKQLPEASVIVNPNQKNDAFKSKSLAGVGVIFYVMTALKKELIKRGWFDRKEIKVPDISDFLDLVALGTIADLVPLDTNNRILVKYGLNLIKIGKARPGILALLKISSRNFKKISADDIGFAIAPRLNAAGRLASMSLGIQCLLADDYDEALQFAVKLDALNRDRKEIEKHMKNKSEEILKNFQFSKEDIPWGICLFQESWHQGVIGILASRVKERYHRPTIIFAPGDNNQLKGSARSINGFHIKNALDQLAILYPELLQKYGGHAMAAGMTINKKNYDKFSKAFDTITKSFLAEEEIDPYVLSDGPLPIDQISLETASIIENLGPWGQAFKEPLFDDTFIISDCKKLKEQHWKLLLKHESSSQLFNAIAFNMVNDWPKLPEKARFVFKLKINEWDNKNTLQLFVEHIDINNEI